MPWEALIWCALAAFSPAASAAAWPRWRARLGRAGEALQLAAPWLHGVGLAYLALLRGAILSRDAGLRGHDLVAWVVGGLGCAAVLGLLEATLRRPAREVDWPDSVQALADEPRWTLYRAAGALWLNSHPLGTGLGLGWGLLELAAANLTQLRQACQDPRAGGSLLHQIRRHPDAGGRMLRLAASSLLFLLTRNFWLTSLSGAILLALLQRRRTAALSRGVQ